MVIPVLDMSMLMAARLFLGTQRGLTWRKTLEENSQRALQMLECFVMN